MADEKTKHRISSALLTYAKQASKKKEAAGEGPPDRMNAGDGDGGISVEKKDRPHDVGEDEVKADQPADGTMRDAATIGEGPDRMNAGDGDGGIEVKKDSRPDDPGEGEVKRDQPTDGETRKAASDRIARIRAGLAKANPELAAKLEKAGEAKKEAAADDKPEPAEKKAGEEEDQKMSLELSQETLAKIGSAIVSTQEGVRYAYNLIEKQAGEEAAQAQIQEAIEAARVHDVGEQVKAAAFNDFQTKVAAIQKGMAEAGIGEDEANEIIKTAQLHQEKIASYEHPLLKAAYAQGMDDAALMAAADEAGGEEGAPPMDEAIPMGGEGLGEEEIMALLQEMIAAGEISEEDVMAALAATEGGAPPAEGGEMPPMEGGEELPPEGGEAPPMA